MSMKQTAALSRQLREAVAKLGGRRPRERAGRRRRQGRAQIWMSLLVAVALLGGLVAAVVPATSQASYVNLLENGSFEDGFAHRDGCGMVGVGWHCFTNGGAAVYGFYDDQWAPVVADGNHSQLIEINTKGLVTADADRYAGIYQTVKVVDWAEYKLSLRGLIRTTVLEGDPWRYRVQVGWTYGPHADWESVHNWQDVGWDRYDERLKPTGFNDYSTRLTAKDDYLTIYVRVWKKWGVPNEEIDVNLDAIGLYGPSAGWHKPDYQKPDYGKPEYGKPDYHKPDYTTPVHPPVSKPTGVCVEQEFVYNGGFEHGFNNVGVGHVGKGWGYFTNGGAAGYGFYDDQWEAVVAEGYHSQLIEINTKGIYPADNDRYAGIYQRISGLTPGKSYELTIRGVLRGVGGGDDDPYRFEAQWGYNVGHNTDWRHVSEWTPVEFWPIQSRTEPTGPQSYRVRFTAPAHEMVLFIRGWMKWGLPETELDLNLDAISIRGCGGSCVSDCGDPIHPPVVDGCVSDCGYPKPEKPAPVCRYTVQYGDTLSAIALYHGVSLHDLMAVNGIYNPDLIYVGQHLQLPGCAYGQGGYHAGSAGHAAHGGYGERRIHVVAAGETFSGICAAYGVDPHGLARANGIANVDFIYVGQQLVIP